MGQLLPHEQAGNLPTCCCSPCARVRMRLGCCGVLHGDETAEILGCCMAHACILAWLHNMLWWSREDKT